MFLVEMENGTATLENNWQFLKLIIKASISLQGIYPREMKRDVHTKNVYKSIIYNSPKLEI